MNYGVGCTCEIAKESTYGTVPAMTHALALNSESMKMVVEKAEEVTLLSATAARISEITGYDVKGSISVTAKPENLGLLLCLALGLEATGETPEAGTTGVYKHTITAADDDDAIPSFAMIIDRKEHAKSYSGLKINTLTLAAQSKDVIKVDLDLVGKAEADDTGESSAYPTKKSFRFASGVVEFDDTGYTAVTAVKFTYSNNFNEREQTLGSGLYKEEPLQNLRTIEAEITCDWDSTMAAMYEDYIANTAVKCELQFQSAELIEAGQPYKFKVTMPSCEIIDCPANVSGRERMKVNLKLRSVFDGTNNPCTIEFYDGQSADYI